MSYRDVSCAKCIACAIALLLISNFSLTLWSFCIATFASTDESHNVYLDFRIPLLHHKMARLAIFTATRYTIVSLNIFWTLALLFHISVDICTLLWLESSSSLLLSTRSSKYNWYCQGFFRCISNDVGEFYLLYRMWCVAHQTCHYCARKYWQHGKFSAFCFREISDAVWIGYLRRQDMLSWSMVSKCLYWINIHWKYICKV